MPTKLKLVVAELERRRGIKKLLNDVHTGQKKVIDAWREGKRSIAVLAPRRAAKSYTGVALCFYICATKPNARCVWMSLYKSDALEVIKPLAQDICHRFGIKTFLNKNTATYSFPNGSSFKIYGLLNDTADINRLRGTQNDLVIIDEVQEFRKIDVNQLITDTISWTLADRKGCIIIMGTPGPVPAGFFFEVAWERRHNWTVIRMQPGDNTYKASEIQAQLEENIRLNPSFKETNTYRREYLGEWVTDLDRLVFKIRPEHYTTDWRAFNDDNYLLGIDFGWSAPSAFVLAVYNQNKYPHMVYLKAEEHKHLTADGILSVIKRYEAAWPGLRIIGDAAAASELGELKRLGVHVTPCKGVDKKSIESSIGAFNDELARGKIKFFNLDDPRHPEQSLVVDQFWNLEWNTNHLTKKRTQGSPRHIADAARYLRSFAFHHQYTLPPPKVVKEESLKQEAIERSIEDERESLRINRRRKRATQRF